LLERLKAQMEPHLSEEQAGFKNDRNTTYQILILRLLAEKAKRKSRPIHHCFIDLQKAFDSIKDDVIWATLKSYGVGQRLLQLLQNICENSQSAMEECRDKLEDNLRILDEASKAAGLKINISKTKTMVSGREDIGQHLVVDSSEVENVTEFVNLDSLLTSDGDCSKEIKRRMSRATAVQE